MTDPVLTPEQVAAFAIELRKWWRFDADQQHTHTWHDREDFIGKALPHMLAALLAVSQQREREMESVLVVIHNMIAIEEYSIAIDAAYLAPRLDRATVAEIRALTGLPCFSPWSIAARPAPDKPKETIP